jgi:hypothetical protein
MVQALDSNIQAQGAVRSWYHDTMARRNKFFGLVASGKIRYSFGQQSQSTIPNEP